MDACCKKNDPKCLQYKGTKSTTRSGKKCQAWNQQSPHVHGQTKNKFDAGDFETNYCRNPNGASGGAWCYTMDKDKRDEYCSIPTCQPQVNSYPWIAKDGNAFPQTVMITLPFATTVASFSFRSRPEKDTTNPLDGDNPSYIYSPTKFDFVGSNHCNVGLDTVPWITILHVPNVVWTGPDQEKLWAIPKEKQGLYKCYGFRVLDNIFKGLVQIQDAKLFRGKITFADGTAKNAAKNVELATSMKSLQSQLNSFGPKLSSFAQAQSQLNDEVLSVKNRLREVKTAASKSCEIGVVQLNGTQGGIDPVGSESVSDTKITKIVAVDFSLAFTTAPTVQMANNGITTKTVLNDYWGFYSEASEITRTGFNAKLVSDDAQISWHWAIWIACGNIAV